MRRTAIDRPPQVWIVYDQRAILDEANHATVLSTGKSLAEAIDDLRDFEGGCVYSPDGNLVFWLDGGEEWDARNEVVR